MKVWAKTIRGEKITRDTIFEYEHADNLNEFIYLMRAICEKLDIPTPIVTRINFSHYTIFNTTRFKERDFIEYVDFDSLVIEALPDKKK